MLFNHGTFKSVASTGFRFFAPFVALFLVLLVFSNLALFRIFVPRFEAEIETLNDLILRSTQIALDERVFRRVEAEYIEVALNDAGHDFYYPLSDDPALNLWRPLESIAALEERVSLADFEPHAISIYFPRWDYVLSSQGFTFPGRSETILEFPWVDRIKSGDVDRWSTVESVVDYNTLPHRYEEMLLFVGPYPPPAVADEPSAYIVVEVPIERVREIVRQYADFSPGAFWIARADGAVLFTNQNSALDVEELAKPTYVRSSVPSDLGRISYNYAIPRDVLFQRSIEVRNGLYLTMVVTVLFSLVVSWFVARYLARPITKIARTAEQVAERLHLDPDDRESNELVRIESTIEGLARRIERNVPIIKEKFFADLLNGVLDEEEIERRVRMLELDDLPPVIQVGLLVQRSSTTSASEEARVHIMQLLPGIESDFVLFYFPVDHERLALIAAAHDEDQFTEFCYDLYDRLHAQRSAGSLSGRHRRAFLSIGPPVDSLARVSVSFDSAKRQVPLYFVTGNPVLTPVDLNVSDHPPFTVPSDDRIGEVLASEDPRTVADFIEGVRDEIRESIEDIDELNRKVCELSRRIKRFIRENSGYGDDQLRGMLDCDFSHFDVLGQLFQSWLEDINGYFSTLVDGRHDSNSRLIGQARAYLDEHYAEDVSLSALAERYGVSYSHLSKLFHDYSGLTFREYLLSLRIDRAAELLLSTGMPVKRVAYESGFRDTGYFIRQFKRKRGLTPVNFRKRGGSGEDS